MASILCLAHYCDTHGPTPLMVTEESAVPCSTCYEEDVPSPRQSLPDTPLPSAALSRNQSFEESQPKLTIPTQSQIRNEQPLHTLNTPPASPRIAALAPQKGNGRKDSSFRKTYDDADRKRAIPCENCAFTLPEQTKHAAGSPKSLEEGGPQLKTLHPCKILPSSQSSTRSASTPTSSDSDCDVDAAPTTNAKSRQRSMSRSITSDFSASSSLSDLRPDQHAHYVQFTSAHDPVTQQSFSLLRAACLRTLTVEALPPPRSTYTPSLSSSISSPTSLTSSSTSSSKPTFPPSLSHSFASLPPSTGVASGGPLMFGDAKAGYTIAFIFRLPDPYARGRRRQYAFICLSRTGERKAVRAFGMLSQVFREMASWITSLAENEAERLENEISSQWAGVGGGGSSGYSAGVKDARAGSVSEGRGPLAGGAFLAGRQDRWEEARMSGLGGRGVRSRGLAELVGMPDFFIRLHERFVELLTRLRFLLDEM